MTTSVDMAGVEAGGVIAEDVMAELFNLSPVDRPCIDSIGTTSSHNPKKEFTDKELSAASSTNKYYQNQDLTSVDDTNLGLRYGNYHQTMIKSIKMSDLGRESRTTYNEDEYLQQIMDAQLELKRDEESAMVSRNAAVAEVKATTAAQLAGMATWAIHNTSRGTGAADAVLDGATNAGGIPTTAPTAGNKRDLTETLIRSALRGGYNDGAEFTHLMSVPDMIEQISNYMFTSSARIATLQSQAPQGNRTMPSSGNGAGSGGLVAQGSVNVFVGNFGTIILTPNRFMSTYTAADTGSVCDVLFFDSRYPKVSYFKDYNTKPISNSGLYDHVAINVTATFIPGATHAITTIADITPTNAVTA